MIEPYSRLVVNEEQANLAVVAMKAAKGVMMSDLLVNIMHYFAIHSGPDGDRPLDLAYEESFEEALEKASRYFEQEARLENVDVGQSVPEDWERLHTAQEGKCAVCGKPEGEGVLMALDADMSEDWPYHLSKLTCRSCALRLVD